MTCTLIFRAERATCGRVSLSYFSTSSQISDLSSLLATTNSAGVALTAHMLLQKTKPVAFNDLFMSTPVKHRESAVLNGARSTHETVALICYDTPPSRPLRMMPCRTLPTAPALLNNSRSSHFILSSMQGMKCMPRLRAKLFSQL